MLVDLGVRDFLERAETVYGTRVAVVDEPDQPARLLGPLTYGQLAALARTQAATLDRLQVPVGGRVAIVSQNSARFLTSFFGVSGWGRILVPINFRLSAPEIEYILEDSGAEIVLVDPELESTVRAVAGDRRVIVLGDDDALFGVVGEPTRWDGDERATATINYTSGTTARPKGVQLTHRNLWLNAVVFALHNTVTDDDVYLHTLPMFHANGWGMPFAVTGLGARHIVLRKVDGAEILRRVENHGVTVMCGAPAVVSAALDAAGSWPGPVPGRDRVRVIVAGAPPPTRTVQRVREELGWEFIQLYGLTETSPLLTVNRFRSEWRDLDALDQARMLGRAGAPALGVEIAVAADGEVLSRSNHVFEGYWNNPAETERALAGGWFHTGDGGVFDEGYVSISDRKKDVIISGGENVSSIEVEDVLNLHPDVRDAAVIGTPDEKWGELVTAIVVTDGDDLTAEALMAHCRDHLAGFKVPRRYEFRSELPRTATGKVQKFVLREPFWQDRDRAVN